MRILKILTVSITVSASFFVSSVPAHSACSECPAALEVRTYHCESGGWTLSISNFSNKSLIRFSVSDLKQDIATALPGDAFNNLGVSFTTHRSPNAPQKICRPNGFWVPADSTYYVIRRPNPLRDTVQGFTKQLPGISTSIFDNPSIAISHYRQKIANWSGVNISQIPSHCDDNRCQVSSTSNSGVSGYDPHFGRISMAQIAFNNPGLSGADIFAMFRGPSWGSSGDDLLELTPAWGRVLYNLGYISHKALLENNANYVPGKFIFRKLEHTPTNYNFEIEEDPEISLIDNKPKGTFVFRKIESSYTYELEVMDIDDDSFILVPDGQGGLMEQRPRWVSIPKPEFINKGSGKSWPTGKKLGQVNPTTGGGHLAKPNPYYCKPLDEPSSDVYIPPYVHDSNVFAEIVTDIQFLKPYQLQKLEALGLRAGRILQAQGDAVEQNSWYFYSDSSAENRLLPPRPQYNCKTKAATQSSCFKDDAYYDQLINRLVVLNPVLNGSIGNHPCLNSNGKRHFGDVRNGIYVKRATAGNVYTKLPGGDLKQPATNKPAQIKINKVRPVSKK